MQRSPTRAKVNNWVNEESRAPGAYDDGRDFGKDMSGAKSFTFPPSPKKSPRQDPSGGPGTYDPDRADGLIKPKTQVCSFANLEGRK